MQVTLLCSDYGFVPCDETHREGGEKRGGEAGGGGGGGYQNFYFISEPDISIF